MKNATLINLRLIFIALIIASLVVGCGLVEVAGDEDFPTEEIELVVTFPAGAAPDSTARALAGVAEEELGQPVVVVNRPGGAGTVGLSEVASAEPDGYTVAFSVSSAMTYQWRLIDTAYEGPDTLQPIAQTNLVPSVLFVRADSGIGTIEDFVERAREEPGSLKVGVPARASVQDLQARLFQREADIEFEIINYEPGEQTTSVLNGTVDAGVAQPGLVTQYVRNGDLQILGFFGEQKPEGEGIDAPLFPDAGYAVRETAYEGVVGPEGIPEERVQTLANAFQTAAESDEFQEFTRETYGLPAYLGAQEFGEKLAADVERNLEYIEEFGLEEES